MKTEGIIAVGADETPTSEQAFSNSQKVCQAVFVAIGQAISQVLWQ